MNKEPRVITVVVGAAQEMLGITINSLADYRRETEGVNGKATGCEIAQAIAAGGEAYFLCAALLFACSGG